MRRRIPIPGTSNLRDVGGYPTVDDRVVASGRLFRSEALVMPGGSGSYAIYDESARAEYQRLGLRTVIDLRAGQETSRAPTAWAQVCGARLVLLPVAEGGEGADTNYIRMLISGELDGFGIEDMARFYTDLLLRRAEQFGAAYRVLAEDRDLPALVHCAAGKDRTGVFTALVLSSLGVPDELVIEDYALTELLRPNRIDAYADRFTAVGRDPEIARVLFESPAAAMASTLRYLQEQYGGARGYLAEMARVPAEVVDAVCSNLLLAP
ncbi:protein-tyrosine-phosphatase [Nocardia jinanensis]|uniref:Protein-tyrosine-phosphatase n=1 Tax=Nocardia jinanensis TaxID=382504 RepID=A0A917RNG2_9NOCA|nr:protein-tyrosine-phosphatase [Nocardia jinanensis]